MQNLAANDTSRTCTPYQLDGSIGNISCRLDAQERFAFVDKLSRSLVEAMNEGVVIADENMRLSFVNGKLVLNHF